MAEQGKLEKMLILAFTDSQKVETGGKLEADDYFEALINPESYQLDYKIKTSNAQGQGTSSTQAKYEFTMPDELGFEFLFDNTGIIDGKPKPNGIFDDVNHFRSLLVAYQGTSHEPYHLKLIWGNLIFKGRAIELGITYKLFNPDGQPIRAVAKAKFKGSIEEQKRAAKENKQSADLTHSRKVKAGDTLPLLCRQIYGEPNYYLQVAQFNKLGSFRNLVPGTVLVFPPLAKTVKSVN